MDRAWEAYSTWRAEISETVAKALLELSAVSHCVKRKVKTQLGVKDMAPQWHLGNVGKA